MTDFHVHQSQGTVTHRRNDPTRAWRFKTLEELGNISHLRQRNQAGTVVLRHVRPAAAVLSDRRAPDVGKSPTNKKGPSAKSCKKQRRERRAGNTTAETATTTARHRHTFLFLSFVPSFPLCRRTFFLRRRGN